MPPIISSKRNRCRSSRCYPKTHSSKPEYNITDFAVVTSQREAFIQPERLDELLLNLFLPNVRQASFPSHRCSQFFRLRACLPIIPYFFGGWKPGRNGDEQALAERVDVGFVHFAIVFEFGFGLFSTSHGHADFCRMARILSNSPDCRRLALQVRYGTSKTWPRSTIACLAIANVSLA